MTDLSQYSVLVLGCGSIGTRHIANLRQLGVRELAASDPDSKCLRDSADRFGVEPFSSLEEALKELRPDAVFVCSPPVFHIPQAAQAVSSGAHAFVEKPLSNDFEGVDRLQSEASEHQAVVQVGYNLRFHPAIQKMKQLLEQDAIGKVLWARVEVGQFLADWRPSQDYRRGYTARRELGGGVILDASHEIDYVLWFLGTPVELTCMAGKVSQLDVDVEDCATILLRFPSGTQADVHMDFVQRKYSRSCVLAGENGTLAWDYGANEIAIFRTGEEPKKLSYDFEANQMYVAEVEHFFECIEKTTSPMCGLTDGKLTLQVALAAKVAACEKKWVKLNGRK